MGIVIMFAHSVFSGIKVRFFHKFFFIFSIQLPCASRTPSWEEGE